MTPEFFQKEILLKTFDEIIKLSETKGHEYTQGTNDRLKNFKDTGRDINLEPIRVCYIFMKKHWDAITTWVRLGTGKSNESFESRINDLILYLVLLKGLWQEGIEDAPDTIDDPDLELPLTQGPIKSMTFNEPSKIGGSYKAR